MNGVGDNMLRTAMQAIGEREIARKENRCISAPIGCGKPIEKFMNQLSRIEYGISSLCYGCQNRIFGIPTECTCDSPCCQADVGVGVITCGSQHCPIHGEGARSGHEDSISEFH